MKKVDSDSMRTSMSTNFLQFPILCSFHYMTTVRKFMIALKIPSEGFKEEIEAEVREYRSVINYIRRR